METRHQTGSSGEVRSSGTEAAARPSGPVHPRTAPGRRTPRWQWPRRRTQVLPAQEGLQVLHEKIDSINYKDVRLLSGFVAESGKIVPRRLTGVCTPTSAASPSYQAGAQHCSAALRGRPLIPARAAWLRHAGRIAPRCKVRLERIESWKSF